MLILSLVSALSLVPLLGLHIIFANKFSGKSVVNCPLVHARKRATRHSKKNCNNMSHVERSTPCSVTLVELYQIFHETLPAFSR